MIPTISTAIEDFKLQIARTHYAGSRYIEDKTIIANSLRHLIFTDDCGAIQDDHTGKVWVVYRGKNQEFRYSGV